MKKLIIIQFFLFSFGIIDAQNFTNSDLPIIVITTNVQTIIDEPKINCNMGIIWNKNRERNSLNDEFNDYNGKIGIEIRGSTSQQYPKKSYGFETRDSVGNNLNVSLMGLPKENDWILYGAYPDKTLMRNEITYWLFEQMQHYSPRFVYCELIIDGIYMGVYSLIEKIKRDKNRIDIAKLDIDDNAGDSLTGGYIIKIDKLTGSSNIPWTSSYQPKLKFLYHNPKYSELTSIQRDYIKNYVDDFEDAVYSQDFTDTTIGYRAYIDTKSFIDFMLLQELGRTVDDYRSSSFMYKDRDSKDAKLKFGPMWDFNLSYGNADYCAAYDTSGWQYNFCEVCPTFPTEPPDWWEKILQDNTFADELQCRWQFLRSTILEKNYIDNWIDSTALYLEESQQRNFAKWPVLGKYVNWNYFVGNTFQEETDYLKWWFNARSLYMDKNLPGYCNSTVIKENIISANNRISVYPNPTTGMLKTTASDNSVIKLFGIDGSAIQVNISDGKINLTHLQNGYYILLINNQPFKVAKQ